MQTAAAKTNGTASNSRLAKVQRGKLKDPLRIMIYGTEGVGKSTLAAHAPSPLWLDIEDGSGRLDVARYPFRDEPGGHVPRSYEEVVAAVDDLIATPSDFKTLVIDTADRLEALVWRYIVDRDSVKVKGGLQNVDDYGFGKGYQIAVDEWRNLCARVDRLRVVRGMSVVVLAHAQVRTFKSPESEDFDRYTLQINDKLGGFLKGWADVVGFACFEGGAKRAPGTKQVKGWSTDRRLLRLVRTAAYDAKGRGGMPAELELDPTNPWAPLAKAIDDAAGLTAEQLAALISGEAARIGDDELTAKVDAAVKTAVEKNETDTLNRYLQDLRRRETKQAA